MTEVVFACPECRTFKTTQRATAIVSHRCPAAGGQDIGLVNTAEAEPIDLGCDHPEGCEAWISGEEMVLYDVKSARAYARSIGWRCDKSGDFCLEHATAEVPA